MGNITVVEFITLDGVVEDPDGTAGTSFGGWAFRFGTDALAGDKFRFGPLLQQGSFVFGRRTWEHFSTLWPSRVTDFAQKLNAARKLVVSEQGVDTSAWSHSITLEGPAIEAIRREASERDVVVIGSISLARQLLAQDLVEELRLLVFPTIAGTGQTLFGAITEKHFTTETSDRFGPATFIQLSRDRVA